jgi:hypothetical protein
MGLEAVVLSRLASDVAGRGNLADGRWIASFLAMTNLLR